MQRFQSICIVLLLFFAKIGEGWECPSKCNCTSNDGTEEKVICSHGNHTEIPGGIPPSTTNLDLSWNNLSWVEGFQLAHLKNLKELNLKWNVIEELDPNAFANMTLLRELTLSRNILSSFPPPTSISPYISLLNLEYNKISKLDDFILGNFSKIQTLLLGNNEIDWISENAFYGLDSLQILELNDNRLRGVPSALKNLRNLKDLTLANNRIVEVEFPFYQITPSVLLLQLRGNPLQRIHPDGFSHLRFLQKLILSDVKNLTEFPHLNGSESLEILRIDRCSLSRVPRELCFFAPKLKSLDLKSNKIRHLPAFEGCSELKILDLSSNEIEDIGEGSFDPLSHLHDLHLSRNRVLKVGNEAFRGLGTLQTLDLSYNSINEIGNQAFTHTQHLEDLNLGNNIFPELPYEGLSRVIRLKAFNNPNLREFPAPENFPNVRSLVLSYAYHCCSYSTYYGAEKPFKSNLQESIIYPTDKEFNFAVNNLSNFWPSMDNFSNKAELGASFWKTFGSTFTTDETSVVLDEFSSGENIFGMKNFANPKREIQCIPLPGPFLPCNDLFDWWTLRCGVWIVFLLALMGNGTVVFVLIFARTKMDVPRFLVCNLAIADFFMGVYLGFLAVVDAATLGDFRKFAIPWQLSSGCQMAGFLGVLSSELSVYTLAVITMERHYAITHAMHLNKRLSLRHASYIMIIGWVFALSMAVLPLFGVSDYRKFAVCLPFETGDGLSLSYVVFLMFINGLAFTILMGCYLKMYCSIRGSQAWNSNDTRIAKRMALLVFTDLLCWFPIAFFSLTAVFGLHLVSLEEAKVFTVFVLPLNSCCNPFLYAILTKQFKKDCVLICKAIEESRVTRGIGRCRHSSNFSNRQTANNTGSLMEKSSKDGQPCICHSGLHPSDEEEQWNHRFLPSPERWARLGLVGRFISRYVLCQKRKSKEALRKARDDYRMRNVRRYLYNTANTKMQNEPKHQRHSSVSSDNFSSSRSDSWRVQNRCGIPLRLLEPRRRNSWAVTRKPSQDSNLSNSRNDSSGTSNSTATWRMSRSSVSSDGMSHSGGGKSSIKRTAPTHSHPSQQNQTLAQGVKKQEDCEIQKGPPSAKLAKSSQNTSQLTNVHEINHYNHPSKSKQPPKDEVDDDEELSAKIATNRPRLVRQSAFFSDEVVIEPEVCPVHGPLIPGTYDDNEDISDIDEGNEEGIEDEEAALNPISKKDILRSNNANPFSLALIMVPRRLSTISSRDTASIGTVKSREGSLQIPGSSQDARETVSEVGEEFHYYVVPTESLGQVRWRSMPSIESAERTKQQKLTDVNIENDKLKEQELNELNEDVPFFDEDGENCPIVGGSENGSPTDKKVTFIVPSLNDDEPPPNKWKETLT